MVAQVASEPTKASIYPYIMLTPLPLTKAVVKKLGYHVSKGTNPAPRERAVGTDGMADSQVHIMVAVKARIVTRPKRRWRR